MRCHSPGVSKMWWVVRWRQSHATERNAGRRKRPEWICSFHLPRFQRQTQAEATDLFQPFYALKSGVKANLDEPESMFLAKGVGSCWGLWELCYQPPKHQRIFELFHVLCVSADIHINNKDPRWVGAWWLGFIISASVVAIASIPYFFFPKELPREVRTRLSIAILKARSLSSWNGK